MSKAYELRAEYRQALLALQPQLDHQHVAELLRGLDVVINAAMDEAPSGLEPTEKWLRARYPQVTDVPREVRIEWHHPSGQFEATAYRNGACYGNPFGYGATIAEACASLMNRLMGEQQP